MIMALDVIRCPAQVDRTDAVDPITFPILGPRVLGAVSLAPLAPAWPIHVDSWDQLPRSSNAMRQPDAFFAGSSPPGQ
jgi:hypothetical protein